MTLHQGSLRWTIMNIQNLLVGGQYSTKLQNWGKMALSVYESNTNQRFVTSLIKTIWRCLCDHICKLHSVLGFMSSPSKLNGSLDGSKQISYPVVLVELVFRLEFGLCWLKIALEQGHCIKCFNRAVVKKSLWGKVRSLWSFDSWLLCYKGSCAFFTLQMSLGKENILPQKS